MGGRAPPVFGGKNLKTNFFPVTIKLPRQAWFLWPGQHLEIFLSAELVDVPNKRL